MKKEILIIIMLALFMSCSKKPQAINYGQDNCHFCDMTIVTKTHASQMVTNKGKQFKFDAIECMVNFLVDKPELLLSSSLFVANYNIPGNMLNANEASFLVCKEIKSPMGANLSALQTFEEATSLQQKFSGKIYSWQELVKIFN